MICVLSSCLNFIFKSMFHYLIMGGLYESDIWMHLSSQLCDGLNWMIIIHLQDLLRLQRKNLTRTIFTYFERSRNISQLNMCNKDNIHSFWVEGCPFDMYCYLSAAIYWYYWITYTPTYLTERRRHCTFYANSSVVRFDT